MTKRQYQMARKVIEADCHGMGMMLDCDGNTCAVGALFAACYKGGVKNPAMRRIVNWGGMPNATKFWPMAKRVKAKFGLSVGELYSLVNANDSCANVRGRRREVLRQLKYIAGF